MLLVSLLLAVSCSKTPRKVGQGVASGEPNVVGQSWDLCTWLGPSKNRTGVFGTDLGFEAPLAAANPSASTEQLLLFGDTYARASDDCQYPVLKQDDLAGRIPLQRPESLTPGKPSGPSDACDTLQYSFEDPSEPTGWRPLRLFPDATSNDPSRALDTGLNRTPITAWGDGTHSFAIFVRDDVPRCDSSADCPQATTCTKDASYRYPKLGGCQPQASLSDDVSPLLCRKDKSDDCSGAATCNDLGQGVCIADAPFVITRDGQDLSPRNWYEYDPRDGENRTMIVASAVWPDQPESYAIGAEYNTNKFINATARTVKHFDPANPDANDYTSGYETLLLWGRPGFVGHDGYQTLPFFAYQPLANLIDEQSGKIAWAPHYFAGYDEAGNPKWSDNEVDAQPIYGIDENLVKDATGRWQYTWKFPEMDYVNQMTVSYVEPLQRWVMLYGGESPHEGDPGRDALPARTYPQSIPGSMYLRAAKHPWGRGRASAAVSEGYSRPRPVLTTQTMAAHLACGEDEPTLGACNPKLPQEHTDLLDAVGSAVTDFSFSDLLEAAAKCTAGGETIDSQYSGFDQSGHLYGAAIVESWTQEVTDALPDVAPGDRAVELYWNVSTWNPYQALLVKTQLRASEFQ